MFWVASMQLLVMHFIGTYPERFLGAKVPTIILHRLTTSTSEYAHGIPCIALSAPFAYSRQIWWPYLRTTISGRQRRNWQAIGVFLDM